MIASAVFLQAEFLVFIRWKWLGCLSPVDYFMIYLDNYPGHSPRCLRGRKIYNGLEEIFPNDYGELRESYGEPLYEEQEGKYLMVEYPDLW